MIVFITNHTTYEELKELFESPVLAGVKQLRYSNHPLVKGIEKVFVANDFEIKVVQTIAGTDGCTHYFSHGQFFPVMDDEAA